jgi:protein SCO1/2
MRNAIAIAATAGAVILAGGAWWAMQRTTDDPFAQCRESQIGTGIASIGGPLSLIDENGAEVTDAEMFTKPTLVYFGYTFCPDVCPLDGARNAEALDMLLADGYDAQMSTIPSACAISPTTCIPRRWATPVRWSRSAPPARLTRPTSRSRKIPIQTSI